MRKSFIIYLIFFLVFVSIRSLQGKAMQPPRDDGNAFFFNKLVQQNADSKNQKSYYLNRYYSKLIFNDLSY